MTRILVWFALLAAVAFGADIGNVRAQESDGLSEEVAKFVAVDASVVVLTDVRIVDGTGVPPIDDRTIVIENGRIARIGPSGEVELPEGAEVLDLTGHTVIPGIVGLHNHTHFTTSGRRVQLGYSAPRLYLGGGVTTIRTIGSYAPYAELNLKDEIERREVPGPRMHVAGPHLTGSGGSPNHARLSDTEGARRVAAYWVEEGATWLKVYNQVTRDQLAAIVEAAHERGARVTGHLCSVTFVEAVELGIDNIEHGFGTNTEPVPDKPSDECPQGYQEHLAATDLDDPAVRRTIETMVEHGVALTSTLAIYETFVPGRPPLEDRVLRAYDSSTRDEVLDVRRQIDEADDSVWSALFPKLQAFEKAFVDAGGLLGAGVDATGFGAALPGYGDQRNYELLIEAGFTPLEAIRIMTLNGARILGEEHLYGSVEEGKLAELVVIEGDPVERPEEIRNVRLVFRDGLGFDSAKLLESVEGSVGVR